METMFFFTFHLNTFYLNMSILYQLVYEHRVDLQKYSRNSFNSRQRQTSSVSAVMLVIMLNAFRNDKMYSSRYFKVGLTNLNLRGSCASFWDIYRV